MLAVAVFTLGGTENTFAGQVAALSHTVEDDGVTIRIGDELFTRYVTTAPRRPVLWPVIGPTGQPVTRSYPLGDGPETEARDHIHHHSLWIGYEGFNKVDFWHQPEKEHPRPFPIGHVVHRRFTTTENDGDSTLLVAENDWLDPNDNRVLSEERTLRFGADEDQRWIDIEAKFIASDGPVEIGDSKEGFLAVRVASTMKVDAKQGGVIVNSEGLTNDAAWGKPAAWADYSGPVDGETVGIAILAHPESFRSPPRWHVRPYGLFAANPFGVIAYSSNSPRIRVQDRPLVHTIPAGESITVRYRVLLHRGTAEQADLASAYEEYAAE